MKSIVETILNWLRPKSPCHDKPMKTAGSHDRFGDMLKEPVKQWPREGDLVFYLMDTGTIEPVTFEDGLISSFYPQGNIFRTLQEAEDERDRRALMVKIREMGGRRFVEGKENWALYDIESIRDFAFNAFKPFYTNTKKECQAIIDKYGDDIKRLL